ncbi:hypothetical protein FNF27_04645 [Cafeteria roenbergensis]|uniref:Cache domain-containing protein n=3 Tax=Cafeteria roenbergensis TaxID=33653 RepID=A0A5A8E8S2_CAFRO|nr:hypothetical protein FNF27_04645 [Cafeteria roenbergensis]
MPSGLSGQLQSVRSLPTVASYMLSRIGAVALGVFVLMLLLVIVGVMSFGDAIADVMLEAFRQQLQRHAGSAALELERYVATQLNGVERDVGRFIAAHTEQALGNNDSLVRDPAADDANFPLAPLADDPVYDQARLVRHPRTGVLVREGDLSVHSFHKNYTVGPDAVFVQQQTSTIDLFLPTILRQSPAVAQVYTALRAGGFLRITPGINATALGDIIDARQRPWYISAEKAGTTVHTSPYIDVTGLGWMITMATPVRSFAFNGTVGPIIGVVGVDVTIKQLQQRARLVSVADRNSAHVIAANGFVVASPLFDGDESAAAAYASGDIAALEQSPPLAWELLPFLDEALWRRISDPAVVIDGGGFRHEASDRKSYFIARDFVFPPAAGDHLEEGEENTGKGSPRYVVLVAVEERTAMEPFALMVLQQRSAIGNIVGYGIAIMAAAGLITGFIVVRFAWQATHPLKRLVAVSEGIAAATAAAASTTGMRGQSSADVGRLAKAIASLPDEPRGKVATEIEEFVCAFKAMLLGSNQFAARSGGEHELPETNPFFTGEEQALAGTPQSSQTGPEKKLGWELDWQQAMRNAGIPFGDPGLDVVVTPVPDKEPGSPGHREQLSVSAASGDALPWGSRSARSLGTKSSRAQSPPPGRTGSSAEVRARLSAAVAPPSRAASEGDGVASAAPASPAAPGGASPA